MTWFLALPVPLLTSFLATKVSMWSDFHMRKTDCVASLLASSKIEIESFPRSPLASDVRACVVSRGRSCTSIVKFVDIGSFQDVRGYSLPHAVFVVQCRRTLRVRNV